METRLFPGLEWQETLLTLCMMSSSNIPDGVTTQEYAQETAYLQLSEVVIHRLHWWSVPQ